MSFIGNMIWFIFAGLWQGLAWTFNGILWSLTIIGIPVGKQCFKMARLSFCPFGKSVDYGGGSVSLILNLIWIIVSGFGMALAFALNGIALCATIVGIPFGLQCFKMAKLALMPFGARVLNQA